MNNRGSFATPFSYIYGIMKDKIKIDGLNIRHVAQIIHRKMITRVSKSGKTYSRKNLKKDLEY